MPARNCKGRILSTVMSFFPDLSRKLIDLDDPSSTILNEFLREFKTKGSLLFLQNFYVDEKEENLINPLFLFNEYFPLCELQPPVILTEEEVKDS